MPLFRRRNKHGGFEKAVADGYQRGIQQAQDQLRQHHPAMLEAIHRIESARSIGDLEAALDDLCTSYEPFWKSICQYPADDRLGALMFFGGAWYDPATRTAERLVLSATGTKLKPGELSDRMTQVSDETVKYSIFDEPFEPPRVKAEQLVKALASYGVVGDQA